MHALHCLATVAALVAAEPIEFEPVPNFFQFPAEWQLDAFTAVGVNRAGEIFLYHRGAHPIMVFDAEGKLLRSFGDDVIGSAHGLRIDKDENVWVTDIGHHKVHRFDPQGKLLASLGTGQAGLGTDEFNKPTDLAFRSDGGFYVTDGYGNSRVLLFSPSGAVAHQWGEKGTEPGQFNTPHSVVIDRQGRLIVGDRENDRIQVFDLDGKQLAVWPGFAPYGLALDPDGTLFVADGRANAVLQLDASGHVVGRFGQKGAGPGEFDLPHMLTFDAAGNLFVTEINGKRVQKFRRK